VNVHDERSSIAQYDAACNVRWQTGKALYISEIYKWSVVKARLLPSYIEPTSAVESLLVDKAVVLRKQ
jgi:hypothetical protein